MKFTLKEKQMDEVRPAKPTAAAARKATPEDPYVLPKGSRKPAAAAPAIAPATTAATTAAPTTAPATAPAAQPGPKFGRKPLGEPDEFNRQFSKQPDSQQGAAQGQQSTVPQAPSAPQPPVAKPEEKAKQAEKAKERYARFINLPFFKKLTASDPKMAQAIMGATSKAQQFAGTANYIPVMVQGLVAAGVPQAEAQKAAQEVAKTDKTAQTPAGGQQPVGTPTGQAPTANTQNTSVDKTSAARAFETFAEQDDEYQPKINATFYNNAINNVISKISDPSIKRISFSASATQEASEVNIPKELSSTLKIQPAEPAQPTGTLTRGISTEQDNKKIADKLYQWLKNDETGQKVAAGKEVVAPEVATEPAPSNQPIRSTAEPKQSSPFGSTLNRLGEALTFKKSSRGIFVLKG